MPSSSRSSTPNSVPNICTCSHSTSSTSSPHSAALPSPPDSPSLDPYADADLDSLSSFPSVSSSIFFSSNPGSPHSHPVPASGQEVHGHAHDPGLIIPSLTLPSALPQPTAYGQTLGELSILLAGPTGAGKTALVEFLADADDVVDVGEWEDLPGPGRHARVLHASTDWIEERDPHGLERFEGSSNVRFVELGGFSSSDNPANVANTILQHVYGTFADVSQYLDETPSSPLLHALLSSGHSSLHTTLLYVTATPLTQHDIAIISRLSTSIPIIPICTTSISLTPPHSVMTHLARIVPHSTFALRTCLFRTPHSLANLRSDAADRFLRWRETEKAVDLTEDTHLRHGMKRRMTLTQSSTRLVPAVAWDKTAWETMLSEDVARRIRKDISESYIPTKLFYSPGGCMKSTSPYLSPTLDPLHLRSLFLLSFSLLAPRPFVSSLPDDSEREGKAASDTTSTIRPTRPQSSSRTRWRWRLVSAFVGFSVFCAGIGLGLVLSS